MPKKPICPIESSPVNPTTRFRLTAKIAHMAKTVPTVIAKPTPCHSANATAQEMTSRFAHTSTLPRLSRRSSRGVARSHPR